MGTDERWRGWLALVVALAPAVAAVWWHPGFATQDGPAHLYNAHVLLRSLGRSSPLDPTFEVRWVPLPNWAGHLTLAGLLTVLPPRAADRAMTTLTLVGLAAATLWLCGRVSGRPAGPAKAVVAALLGMNVTWLLGFGGFLLGAALFPLTLGVWWSGRDGGWSPRRALALGALGLLGYACHLVSLGLTVIGLVVLEVLTPARPGSRRGRAAATAAGLLPLVPLGIFYSLLMRRVGHVAPEWHHLTSFLSVRAWAEQITWVDPITLARKDYLPLVATVAWWHRPLAPVVWLEVGLAAALVAAFLAGSGPQLDPERRGFWALAALLIVGGVLGPDALGAQHGDYLSQRVELLGLVALLSVVRFDGPGLPARVGTAAVVVALIVQSALVWDYARLSERTAGALFRAAPLVGQDRRIATRLTDWATPFRANPLAHADCGLGVGTGNVVWSNYETRHYYFPVQFRPGLARPDSAELEWIARYDTPDRPARWAALLDEHHASIDVVLGWNPDPALDPITARWFPRLETDGPVRVFSR